MPITQSLTGPSRESNGASGPTCTCSVLEQSFLKTHFRIKKQKFIRKLELRPAANPSNPQASQKGLNGNVSMFPKYMAFHPVMLVSLGIMKRVFKKQIPQGVGSLSKSWVQYLGKVLWPYVYLSYTSHPYANTGWWEKIWKTNKKNSNLTQGQPLSTLLGMLSLDYFYNAHTPSNENVNLSDRQC